jgi:hypothetical protein
MDDTAVPSGLVLRKGAFLFDNDQVQAGIPSQEFTCHRQANDPTTDHADSPGTLRHCFEPDATSRLNR